MSSLNVFSSYSHDSPEYENRVLELSDRLREDGIDDERKEASRDFGGHALALTLLGRYLKVVHGGDIRKRGEIPYVMDEQKQGAHARRVMESYERWLDGKPELDILRLMGLFDRPAEKGALEALRAEPTIEGLTENIQKLSEVDWKYAVDNLQELRLLARPSTAGFGAGEAGLLDRQRLTRACALPVTVYSGGPENRNLYSI